MYDYPNEIMPGLYLGASYHRMPYILESLKIKNIITMNGEYPLMGYNNLIFNIHDHPSQCILNILEKTYNFIDYHLSRGEKVLVHCAAGKSRSASIVVYYLAKKFGITFDIAYGIVKFKRNIVDINPGFQYQLRLAIKSDLK